MQLIINRSTDHKLTPEERAHNQVLLERYMPEFSKFFLEAKGELGAVWENITIDVPDGDLGFVKSLMDPTKSLVEK